MSYSLEIKNQLQEASVVLNNFLSEPDNLTHIEKAASLITDSLKKDGRIFTCGNGGSQCDAMHFAEELTGVFRKQRRTIPAVAISDPGHITCVANDLGFENIFSRYLEGWGKTGDILFCLSTSGNSPNIINAALVAKKMQMKVIALTGKTGGKLASLADVEIRIPHQGYSDRIQEIHIKVIHIIILLIEKMLDLDAR